MMSAAASPQHLSITSPPNSPCGSTNHLRLLNCPSSIKMKNAGQSFLAPLSVGYTESFIGKLKAAPAHTCSEATEIPVTSWDNLGFDPLPTDYMYVMKCPSGSGSFSDGKLLPFGNIEFNPFSSVLNYGQGIIEGLKAHKKSDDSILLFRPEQNALRMAVGADRLCMVAPTVEQFVEAVKVAVSANRRWIPPPDKGFLHIRPLLLGTSPQLSLTPSSEFIFLIYVTPVRNYFEGGLEPIDLVVDDKTHRAVPGGVGHVKAIGNYAGILRAQATAKENGFSDVLYVDSVHNRYLEEVSTANIFVVKDKKICTPEVGGTILPGITRASAIDLARTIGFQVEERLVSIEEMVEADEVFCTGNAVGLLPVGSITYHGRRVCYGAGGPGEVTQRLSSDLTSIQMGLTEDTMGWTVGV
ncbi:unnamed protein product [Linum tenue]|uniref:Branched-chain-amino-acid aminotransferase n=1 Tax=Linum tenue TaxID=586396 RepID=A0AAV0P136_9ROSI|nr:unnamed protein product [Linum tenue]